MRPRRASPPGATDCTSRADRESRPAIGARAARSPAQRAPHGGGHRGESPRCPRGWSCRGRESSRAIRCRPRLSQSQRAPPLICGDRRRERRSVGRGLLYFAHAALLCARRVSDLGPGRPFTDEHLMAVPHETGVSSPARAMSSLTPAMRQYQDAKRQYPGAIVFFLMGDFYEMFYEDALVASRALELTLTSRSKDAAGGAIPMCGIPYHALETYLPRLVRKGYRVAICEQVEDPRKAKGIVKREVVRVFSPGTLLDAGYLDAREPSFLLSIAPGGERIGVALLDLSTGEFTTAEYVGADRWRGLNDELAVLRPREIVAPADALLAEHLPAIGRAAVPVTGIEPWHFELDTA